MRHNSIMVISVVLLTALLPLLSVNGQIVGGGNCTSYGCMEIQWMSKYDIPTHTRGCWQFEFATGRRVRNSVGANGGLVKNAAGTQTVNIYANDCSTCTVPPGTQTAILGSPAVNPHLTTTFDRFTCEP
jgi:hypothetical protein